MWRLLRSQVFSGPMCSDQSYIQTSEWTLQLFSFFFLQNHSFTILWVCVLLSFAKNLCDSFISLVVHSLYCKTLWRPVWANCDLWTESWNANNVFWLFSLFAKFTTKLDGNLIFQPRKLVQRNSRQGSRVRRAQLCQLCWENCQTPRDCIWLSFTLFLPIKMFFWHEKGIQQRRKIIIATMILTSKRQQ